MGLLLASSQEEIAVGRDAEGRDGKRGPAHPSEASIRRGEERGVRGRARARGKARPEGKESTDAPTEMEIENIVANTVYIKARESK